MRFLCLLLLGLTTALPLAAGEPNTIPPEHQVILKGDWQPTTEQTQKALAAAEELIRKNAAKAPASTFPAKYEIDGAKEISRNLAKYGVQFLGKVQNGKRIVHCSFFPAMDLNREFPTWRTQEVYVLDGGFWFWRVDYDPATESCDNYQHNGDA